MHECELCGETQDVSTYVVVQRTLRGPLDVLIHRCRDRYACLDRLDAVWDLRERLNALRYGVG